MPAVDGYAAYNNGSTGPAGSAVAVTPHNTTELAAITRAVWIGLGGDLSCLMADGTTCVFFNIGDGTMLPIRVKRINSTDTTAEDIVALW